MTTLRWILIACGLLLLTAIYWWGRRDGQRRAEATMRLPPDPGGAKAPPLPLESEAPLPALLDPAPPPTIEPIEQVPFEPPARIEPTLGEAALTTEVAEAIADEGDVQGEEPAPLPDSKIVALRLVASVPRFSGAPLRAALEAESLEFGKYQIFHRMSEGNIVFSVASMVEPGNFDLEHMFHEQYPGIVLFTQFPGVLDGVTTVNELIACARKLQESLGGVVQDGFGVPLQPARIEQLRREVRDFEAVHQARARSESSHP